VLSPLWSSFCDPQEKRSEAKAIMRIVRIENFMTFIFAKAK